MEKSNFIFIINAERHYNILVRIITTLNRRRIPITEMASHFKPGEDMLRVTVSIEGTREHALSLSKKLDKEIDIISIHVFEQLN